MQMTLLIAIVLLAVVAASFLAPKFRHRRTAQIATGVVALLALGVAFYSLGVQAGRDAALRDNRADARAAVRSAEDTATGSASR